MKKQNYFSALIILIMSAVCFTAGVWVGTQKYFYFEKSFLLMVEGQMQQPIHDAHRKINLLNLIEMEEYDKVKELLKIGISNELTPNEFDKKWGLEESRARLKIVAEKYQEEYCVAKCL